MLEDTTEFKPEYDKMDKVAGQKVLPVVVQEGSSGRVLMLGYMNELALEKTRQTKILTLWSTSRRELWIKGATSGNTFQLLELRVNCEQNSLLAVVSKSESTQGICHSKDENGQARESCYYRRLKFDNSLDFLTKKLIQTNSTDS